MSILEELNDLEVVSFTLAQQNKYCFIETIGTDWHKKATKSDMETLIQELTELKDKMI